MQSAFHAARTRAVDHVVDPAAGLLDPEAAPLGLGHEVVLGYLLGNLLGQDDMPDGSMGEEKKEVNHHGKNHNSNKNHNSDSCRRN